MPSAHPPTWADGGPPAASAMLDDVRFSLPVLDRAHVSRSRLLDLLASSEKTPLVLVSGPAGSGKTELVAEWVRSSPDAKTGWITFEDADAEFWSPVLECLRRSGVSVPKLRGPGSAHLLAGRRNVLALAAALVDTGERWTLVVDGYEVTSVRLAQEIDFLVKHASGHLRLVLLGRVDPVLPLYRFRLAGEITEVRAADLAFTDVEAARLLTRRKVTLPPDSVHELNDLVNGWAAGLVFAARALSTTRTPEKAVAGLLEQNGDINEYLVGEVLDKQQPEMRRFLLATAVTDVVAPGLVEELLGPKAVPLLTAAARANVFMETVPDSPGTFRYYPFFRALLRARLAYESPAPLQQLHRRAARWYRREGAVEHSLHHLVSAGAWQELAAQLVDDGLVGWLLLEGSGGPVRRAAARLPSAVPTAEACVVRAAVALTAGDTRACAAELARARRVTDDVDGTLGATVDVVDAVRGCVVDDVTSAERLTDLADRSFRIERPSTSSAELGSALAYARGVALLRYGRLDEACEQLTRAGSSDAVDGYPYFRARCWGTRAIAHVLKGELSPAETTAARALVDAAEGGPATGEAVAGAHLALALVAVEQYDAETARRHLAQVATSDAAGQDPVQRAVTVMVQAALEWMDEQTEEAGAALLAAAEELAPTDPWLSEILRAAAARVAVAEGMPTIALEAVGELGSSTLVVAAAAYVELGEDEVGVELARSMPDDQLALHARVSRRLSEALVASRSGQTARGRTLVDEALRLAAPAGLRRPFRQTGPAVAQLLSDNADLLLQHQWLTDRTVQGSTLPAGHALPPAPEPGERQTMLVENLTPKELEVLGGLDQLLTTEEIAAQMYVSVNTVRTHVRSVLRKLGVNRRNAAIRRARELGLLSA